MSNIDEFISNRLDKITEGKEVLINLIIARYNEGVRDGLIIGVKNKTKDIANDLLENKLFSREWIYNNIFDLNEQDKKDYLPNGNYVEDTGNHFCYIVDEKTYEPLESVLITMKMSQKSKSKGWNSTTKTKSRSDDLGSYVPPTWSSVYRLTSVKEENTKEGYKWHGWSITFDKWLDENKDAHILEKTKAFYETVKQNDVFGIVDFEAEVEVQSSDVSKQKKPAQVTANTQDDPF